MSVPLRIGLVGAAGNIARRLVRGLGERYEFSLFDKDARDADAINAVNIAEADTLAGQFDGLDAVIHLAAVHRGNPPFEAVLRANILGTYNVVEEAVRAGVKRVVFASTNHVQNGLAVGDLGNMGAMSAEFAASGRRLTARDDPAPDSFYGVSKLCGEDLGRYYALYLKKIAFIALRIGWSAPADPRAAPLEKVMSAPEVERHYRALFMSERDTVQLFDCALKTDRRFFVGYGTSDNSQPIFDLVETKEVLGYAPQDNADDYFREAVRLQEAADSR